MGEVEVRRPGPAPFPPRSGDKEQARQRINVEVRSGRRPHPNTLPCVDCGHVWKKGERRHEYDHHKGYAAKNHLNVVPVCTTCHAKRDNPKARQTHCEAGHRFTESNTKFRANGTRECRECSRIRKRKVRTAEWWVAYRKRKKIEHGRKNCN